MIQVRYPAVSGSLRSTRQSLSLGLQPELAEDNLELLKHKWMWILFVPLVGGQKAN
jgi:hypothetical protein